MATKGNIDMEFVPMITIGKKLTSLETGCSHWVATEKIHGSNFQFFTRDGKHVHLGSRRTRLDGKVFFLKCNLQEFLGRYSQFIRQLFHVLETNDRWGRYRTLTDMVFDDDEEPEEEDVIVNNDKKDEDVKEEYSQGISTENSTDGGIELRIFGELYGGGGIDKDVKSAVQREIIYADDFRFYVFGININRKWTTVTEMNDLCKLAGFPYYATPVCPPTTTIEELTSWLTTSGFMSTRSKHTDKNDDKKTTIEGVVMSPLTRNDFRLHAVKLLAGAFVDVRTSGKGKSQRVNYCTKARYNSVLSKLDLPEREDTTTVIHMFIADIIKEIGAAEVDDSRNKGWTNCVRNWLIEDGYLKDESRRKNDEQQE